MVRLHTVLGVLILVSVPGGASAQKNRVTEAAQHFDRGQLLYQQGRFAEAIKAFEQANALAPHFSSQFNIARCHENLGNSAKAVQSYKLLLETTADPAKKLDLKQRIRRLQSRPVKVFVSSEPTGASVTVDGRADPEVQKTPSVVRLTPGEHILLLQLEGHHLAARRIVVQMEKEQLVQVKLEPLPPACPPPCPTCPTPRPCPKLDLVDERNLHLHLSGMGAFGWTSDQPTGLGPAVQLHITFKRLVFGGHFAWFFTGEQPIEEQPVEEPVIGETVWKKINSRWLLAQLEGGWMFPLRSSYLYTTLGLGLSAERVVFVGDKYISADKTEEEDYVKEEFGFAWSLGGGMEAMATSWLSFGVNVRAGMIHGNRVDKTDPHQDRRYDEHHFPFATIWGSTTLHL